MADVADEAAQDRDGAAAHAELHRVTPDPRDAKMTDGDEGQQPTHDADEHHSSAAVPSLDELVSEATAQPVVQQSHELGKGVIAVKDQAAAAAGAADSHLMTHQGGEHHASPSSNGAVTAAPQEII